MCLVYGILFLMCCTTNCVLRSARQNAISPHIFTYSTSQNFVRDSDPATKKGIP